MGFLPYPTITICQIHSNFPSALDIMYSRRRVKAYPRTFYPVTSRATLQQKCILRRDVDRT